MKLIIAGSRTINSYRGFFEIYSHFNYGTELKKFLGVPENASHFEDCVECLVTGCARGADQIPYLFCGIPNGIKEFPADWEKYGKKAGPIRNRQMAEYADALLLIWDGNSSGSKNMKSEMERLGKPVYEIILNTLRTF